ncbi:hypothetical protein BN1007_70505 [Klebsiella variicola]|nr:hypothetical protein BN1200_290024 [Klebsiella variicola]CTQ16193.1 hypothetical protein BN1007_70505 [Klebsiella variicola]CTQ25034.1 hypothetical protein BN1200_690027 [Klebsiella variicola]
MYEVPFENQINYDSVVTHDFFGTLWLFNL